MPNRSLTLAAAPRGYSLPRVSLPFSGLSGVLAQPRAGVWFAVGLGTVLVVLAQLPGRLAEWLGAGLDALAGSDAAWISPSGMYSTAGAGAAAMLFGAAAVKLLLDPGSAAGGWHRRGAAGLQPVLRVPLVRPARVAEIPGTFAVRLTCDPADHAQRLPDGTVGRAVTGQPTIGQPVMAPASGVVQEINDDPADGMASLPGSHMLIRLDTGFLLRLDNLARDSIVVWPGQVITAGALIGTCRPTAGGAAELRLQVLASRESGNAPVPFRFAAFMEMAVSGPRWIDEAAPLPGTVIRGVRPVPA